MLNSYQLPFLIESSLILAVGYLMYRVLFANDTAYIRNRIYLISVLFFSFLLPWISLPVYAKEIGASSILPISRVNSVPINSYIELASADIDWSLGLFTFYMTIVIILSIRLVLHLIYIRQVITTSKSRVINGMHYVITDKITTPSSIFNTLFSDQYDLPKSVVDHERIHMRHGHTWDILLLEVVKIILWFNPFIYLLSRALKDNHEYISDHLASKLLKDRLEYPSLLLHYAKSKKSTLLLNTFSSITKKRIIMLSKDSTPNPFKLLFVIPVFIVLLSVFSCDTYEGSNSETPMDSLSITPETRLDTIIQFDVDTGQESMTIERVFVNDIETIIDTTIIFHSETMEEEVQIIQSERPRTEVLLETYTAKEYNRTTGNLETNTYHRYPQDLIMVMDTIVTFDYDTYEENVTIVEESRAREELVGTQVLPKDQLRSMSKK